jgi:hypothetical protein
MKIYMTLLVEEATSLKTAYSYEGNNISQDYSTCILRVPEYTILFYNTKTGHILLA